MARRGRSRTSRRILGVLAVTMAIGGAAYYHNVHKNRALAQSLSLKAVAPGASSTQAIVSTVTPAPTTGPAIAPRSVQAAPMTTITPTTLPATRPVRAAAPATANSSPKAPVAPAAVPAAAMLPGNPLAKAKSLMDGGDLLGARSLLNNALAGNALSGASADAARSMLGQISQTVLFSKKKFADDSYQVVHQVQSGERLSRIADRNNVTWEFLCRINGMSDPKKLRSGQYIKIPKGPFHAVVSKSAYRLDVYLGSAGGADSLLVISLPVGLGKDNSTPTGTWSVGSKAHPATYYSPRGEGVIEANDPKNPLGGYWIGLVGVSGAAVDKNSYGIHGTIEPETIGKQASMGCVRLRHEDIDLLYQMLIESKSSVVIRD